MKWPSLEVLVKLALLSAPWMQQSQAGQGSQQPESAQRAQSFLQQVISPREDSQDACKPTGLIQDACCDYASIESLNEHVFPDLASLVQRDFFRFWKVDLLRECPFWDDDDALCGNRACAVEELATPPPDHLHWSLAPQLASVTPLHQDRLDAAQQQTDHCYFRDSDFCRVEDLPPNHSNNSIFVDLVQNPERFTGYAGPSANRVWKAIYQENCFAYPAPSDASSFSVGGGGSMGSWVMPARDVSSGGSGFAPLAPNLLTPDHSSLPGLIQDISAPMDPASEESCLEKRVYYRLISGLHASISIHLCHDYLDPETGEWRSNLECFITRIAEHPERLTNVYFDYVVFLRAHAKAAPFLRQLDPCGADGESDAETKQLMASILDGVESADATFDESQMFVGPQQQLKEEFKQHFRNVSRIMDCVGCDKCRLWGGLQVSGLGTALKFLFEAPDCTSDSCDMQVTRAEVVAFFNTFHRLSESLMAIEEFRDMLGERSKQQQVPPVDAPMEEEEKNKEPSIAEPEPPVPDPALPELDESKQQSPPPSHQQRREPRFKNPTSDVYQYHAPPERQQTPRKERILQPRKEGNLFLSPPQDGEQNALQSAIAFTSEVTRTLWSLLMRSSRKRSDAVGGKDEL